MRLVGQGSWRQVWPVGLRGPGDGAQSVRPGVLQVLTVISKWQQPCVTKPAGTVTVDFQATAGSWRSMVVCSQSGVPVIGCNQLVWGSWQQGAVS